MVKYLLTMRKQHMLIFCLLLVFASSLSPEPLAVCTSPTAEFNDFPISLQETQSFNPNEMFRGYNLRYELLNPPDFVYIRDKMKLTKTQEKQQPGLKSYHFDHQRNRWGTKLVTISEQNSSSIVRWGVAGANDTVPTLSGELIVENQPSIRCFDAIWMRHLSVIMVDCVKNGSFGGLQNIFLYLNTTSQVIIPKIVNNDMYVPFRNITRRRMLMLEEDGETYMMRANFANSVDTEHNHNTYLQIFLLNDPFRPWTIRVIDRSFLHQDKLSITDFKIYLGDIYILDYHTGVTRFDITGSQTIIITGRYRTDSGYERLGVYSNNLDNQFLLVLANNHGIYQVDWSNTIRPQIIAKYSIMEGSHVSSLWVTEEYVVAQIRANVTNIQNQTQDYHSTFIFDRGTRTYMNAYAVIPHSSFMALIDMDIENRQILSIDEDRLSVYQIDEPIISLLPTNNNTLNKQFQFTIQATSSNEYNGHNAICSFKIKVVVVPVDSMALWPTGRKVPQTYYANFPGQLIIPLDRYVIGANVTWGVQQNTTKGDLPSYWIYQQNTTILHWPKKPSLAKITFLRQEQFDTVSTQYIFIYTQDAANITHISFCKTSPGDINVYCQDDAHHPTLNQKIVNLTATVFIPYSGQYVHLSAIVFQTFPNQVFIVDVTTKQMPYRPIIMPDGFQGRIQSIQFLGQYLVIVLRHMKTIVFYDMNQCHDHQEKECQEIYRIDSIMMDKLGVKYFSPLEVYTSDFHPYVLFVQNVDSVIILDITPSGRPILLEVIESPASKEPGFWKWKMAITHGHLVLINPPNTIQQHSLEQLYTRKQVLMTKTFPVYNYTIPDNFDCDFSDQGDLLYITAIDPQLPAGSNSVILVYRSGFPAVSTFYDVFHINGQYNDLIIDATGNFADYVSVAMGSMLLMYRQYEVPILVFQDTFFDFKFNLTFTNDAQGKYRYLSTSAVEVANFPKDIIVNFSKLNETGYLSSQVKYDNKHQEFTFNDSNWFTGQVINYTLQGCTECGNKFKVINHLEDKRDLHAQTDMEDYVFTPQGGVIQQFQSLIKMRHNGSIDQITLFPSVLDGQFCTHIQHSWVYDYTLSACLHQGQVYLYTTTYTASKPFVNGPFYSGAKAVSGIHIMEDIMIIVDVDEDPSPMTRAGGILIYAMNHDPFDPEMFDQIQFIDRQDLQSAPEWIGGPVFIGNAELVFTNDTQLYRLVITEMRHGLFIVDFRWSRGRTSIQITKVEFLDLNKLLVAQNLHMPNQAYYEAVTITTNSYNPTFKYWQTEFVVTTRNFHIFQINCHISQTGQILTTQLAKVFYRYGFFETFNYIKQFDGYFAVTHKIPVLYEVFDFYNQQVLTVYDTKQRWTFGSNEGQAQPEPVKYFQDTKVPVYQMLGGMVLPKGRVSFDFNFTFTRNRTDPFRNIGLLVLHAEQDVIRQVLLHDQLTIVTEGGINSDQNAKLVAYNDFSTVKIPISILVPGLSGGAIAAIVIGCLLIAIGGGYMIYRWNLKRKSKIQSDIERSLIERDTYDPSKPLGGQNQDDEEEDEQEDDDQDDDEQEQDDEQEGEQAENLKVSKPEQQSQITQHTLANKQTVVSEPVNETQQVQKNEPQAADQQEGEQGKGEQ